MRTDELSTPKRSKTFSRVRALLVGGVVLGVGGAVTLAAWNDSEFAQGDFAAGQFGIEGSADGTAFAEHTTADDAAQLTFEVGASALTPGDQVYAGYAVRLTEDSTYGADVLISTTMSGANADNLSVAYAYTDSATCDAAAFSAGSNAGVAEFALDDAAPSYLCFEVTAGDDLIQGASGDLLIEFAATSADELAQ